jgi:hypothetical protein
MKRILTTLAQKWPEYLIEAIVIVASILGAYALDNWNEQRQREEKLKALFEKVKDDLAYDLSRLDKAIQYNKQHFLLSDSILQRTFSWKSKPVGLLNPREYFGIGVLTFSKDSYTELMKVSETIPKEYTPLMNQLHRVFNVYSLRTGSSVQESGELQSRYMQIVGKFDWHDQIVSGADLNTKAIDYYENDPEFRTIYRKYHSVLLTYIYDCYLVAGYNTLLIDEISSITGNPFDWSTILSSVEEANSEQDIEQYTGTFVSLNRQDTIKIRLENGYPSIKRKLNDVNAKSYLLRQGQDTLTSYPNISSFIFHRDSTGSVSKLTTEFLKFTNDYQKMME